MRRLDLGAVALVLWALSVLVVLFSLSSLRTELRTHARATADTLDTHKAAIEALQRSNAQHETQLGGMRHLTPVLDRVADRVKALDAREAQHYRHFLSGTFASR